MCTELASFTITFPLCVQNPSSILTFVFQQQEIILSPLLAHFPPSLFLLVSRGSGRNWCFINSFLFFTLRLAFD